MANVNLYDAKTRLSQLVDQVIAGEDVVVCRHGRPVARLTRLEPSRSPIRFGLLAGKVRIPDDFDAPLPDDVQASFEGR
ncbi:MAG: hypothetical protein RL375_3806 [Pseudomonadota bacterium]|jgi:prevent-host-death family protein